MVAVFLSNLTLLLIVMASPVATQVFNTQQQALACIFPKPQSFECRTLFLDDRQVDAIQKPARAPKSRRKLSRIISANRKIKLPATLFCHRYGANERSNLYNNEEKPVVHCYLNLSW
jgi:hypothetical protein